MPPSLRPEASPIHRRAAGFRALAHGLPIALVMLALLAYWYGIANRYTIFLYEHDMGPLFPDTSPFSAVTTGRYAMSGLVAGGAALVLYAAVLWGLGRISRAYRPPPWMQVWGISAVALLIGVPLIVMTLNHPTLPPGRAALVTLTALIGAAGLSAPGQLAARRPWELIWLAADGIMLMPVVTFAASIEDIPRWLAHGQKGRVVYLAGGIVFGMVGLLGLSGLRWLLRTPVQPLIELWVAGLCANHAIQPLIHHTLGTDGYFYISTWDNFFADSIWIQLAAWGIGAVLCVGITALRRRLAQRCSPAKREQREEPLST